MSKKDDRETNNEKSSRGIRLDNNDKPNWHRNKSGQAVVINKHKPKKSTTARFDIAEKHAEQFAAAHGHVSGEGATYVKNVNSSNVRKSRAYNPFRSAKKCLKNAIKGALFEAAEEISKGQKEILRADGHIDTLLLFNSLHGGMPQTKGNVISISGFADAQNPDDGSFYAQFIEQGTGVYREGGGGSQQPWRYKDRQGNWHTTEGMRADPFLEPPVRAITEKLGQVVYGNFTAEFNIDWYKGKS